MKQKDILRCIAQKEVKYLYNKLIQLKYEKKCLYDKIIYIVYRKNYIINMSIKLCCKTNLKRKKL